MKQLIVLVLSASSLFAVVRIPGPGGVAGAPATPSFVNSVANYCSNSSTCPLSNADAVKTTFTATAGNAAVAFISFESAATACSGFTLGATMHSTGAALTQIGTTVDQGYSSSSHMCLAAFKIDSLPTTGSDWVVFTGVVVSFASVGVIQIANGGGGLDGSCTGSNNGTVALNCSSAISPTQTDAIVAAYADFNVNGTTITAGGSSMTDAAQWKAAGQQNTMPSLSLAYRITSSSTTPGFTDTAQAAGGPQDIFGVALK